MTGRTVFMAAAALAAGATWVGSAAAAPSCGRYFDGLGNVTITGSVSMQQNPTTGSIQWGIWTTDPRAYGTPPWNVRVRVGTYRVTKVQPYPPHSSIPGRLVIPHTIFNLVGTKAIPHGTIHARLTCEVQWGKKPSPRPGYQAAPVGTLNRTRLVVLQ